MAKLTYANKTALNENPNIAVQNKITDDDMNEIKTVVNENDDNVGDLTTLKTTTKSSVVGSINELVDAEVYSTTEVKTNKVWIDNKSIYRKVLLNTNLTLSSGGALVGNIGTNVDTWVSSYHRVGTTSGGAGKNTGRTGYLNSNYYSGIQLSNNGDVRLYAKEDTATTVYCLIIMEYTKSTD